MEEHFLDLPHKERLQGTTLMFFEGGADIGSNDHFLPGEGHLGHLQWYTGSVERRKGDSVCFL